jgi:hypothetical protein
MPAKRLPMRLLREILRLRYAGGLSQRAIARCLNQLVFPGGAGSTPAPAVLEGVRGVGYDATHHASSGNPNTSTFLDTIFIVMVGAGPPLQAAREAVEARSRLLSSC